MKREVGIDNMGIAKQDKHVTHEYLVCMNCDRLVLGSVKGRWYKVKEEFRMVAAGQRAGGGHALCVCGVARSGAGARARSVRGAGGRRAAMVGRDSRCKSAARPWAPRHE